MDEYENLFSPNGAPLFDGSNYELWNIRMRIYLQPQGCGIHEYILNGYITPKRPKSTTKKELKKNNTMAMDDILDGLLDFLKDKIGKCASTKELRKLLKQMKNQLEKKPIPLKR